MAVLLAKHPNWGGRPHTRYAHDKNWKLHADGRFYHFKVDPLEEYPLAESDLSAEGRAAKEKLQGVIDGYK